MAVLRPWLAEQIFVTGHEEIGPRSPGGLSLPCHPVWQIQRDFQCCHVEPFFTNDHLRSIRNMLTTTAFNLKVDELIGQLVESHL